MRKRIIATSLNKKRFLSGVFLTLLATVVNAQPFPYQQAGLPVSQRVDDLMKRMTLEEKVAMVHAQSNFRYVIYIRGTFSMNKRWIKKS